MRLALFAKSTNLRVSQERSLLVGDQFEQNLSQYRWLHSLIK